MEDKDLVFKGNDNQAITNSLLVAEKFGKTHKHVLESIREIFAKSEKSAFVENQQLAQMFQLIEVEQPMPVGGGTKKTPAYVMNRDGFTLLAMGFTGDKAIKFKLEYIAAFNHMETELRLSAPSYQIQDPIARAKAWIAEQQRFRELQDMTRRQHAELVQSAEEIKELSQAVAQMQPKVTYYDIILQSKGTCTVTQIAQDYGMTAKTFNTVLQNLHIQRKVGTQWVLYGKYLSQGYVHSRPIDIIRTGGTHETKYNTEWTSKGRIFLYGELKKNGILPLIEKT